MVQFLVYVPSSQTMTRTDTRLEAYDDAERIEGIYHGCAIEGSRLTQQENEALLRGVGRITSVDLATASQLMATAPEQLVNEAIRRGCTNYSAYSKNERSDINTNSLPDEVIGCALLIGDLGGANGPATFDRIRIAAMLMSVRTADPFALWWAAMNLAVAARLRQIAALGAVHDAENPNWSVLLPILPTGNLGENTLPNTSVGFPTTGMPGLSRFTSETHARPDGAFPHLTEKTTQWLRARPRQPKHPV